MLISLRHYHVVQTALVDSYPRTGSCIVIARDLFDEMSERNLVSWTAMISGYMRAKPCVGPRHYQRTKPATALRQSVSKMRLERRRRCARRVVIAHVTDIADVAIVVVVIALRWGE
ncbi:hypothetical protein V6N11_052514 [Hibiscus sabdariffa]|uniref:Pentatricopeptide repeat-containing protein n=1 Tax=Hibiscus sabdariffa TaxID=183260 RepID=A0ABR2UAK1_9ROSI